jgi:endo-1,4-beta-D-glucanase Y
MRYIMNKRLLALLVFLLLSCNVPTKIPPAPPTIESTATVPTPIPSPTQSTSSDGVSRPFPQHTQYAAGSIFPNHRSQAQLDDDVSAFYEYWKETYVIESGTSPNGNPMYRIAFGKDQPGRDTTVSEGQGYGMIIVPLMAGFDEDAQKIFDGLWEFARAHPSEADPRLMDWNIPDTENGNVSAFDGDADIAYGLLLADAQWGSDGQIDYRAEAETYMLAILESTIGSESHLPMLGDWTEQYGEVYSQYTPRSSDFMLVNFRAFGRATRDAVWTDIIWQSQYVMNEIQSNYSPVSGLMPDFIVLAGDAHIPQPAPAEFLEGPHDGHYNYNAGRVPWRVGSDALLNDDEASRDIAQKISHWIETSTNGDPANIRAGYDLDGSPLPNSDYFTTFFVAPMGVAAMSDPNQQEWLNRVYDSVYAEHIDYYEDSVNLLCLLVMSGNAWTP